MRHYLVAAVKAVSLPHPKSVLLISYRQSKLCKAYLILNYGMGTYYQVAFVRGYLIIYLFLFFLCSASGEEPYPHPGIPEQLDCALIVLLCKYFCRDHQCALTSAEKCVVCAVESHYGLSASYVALYEPLHGNVHVHVPSDFFHHPLLSRRKFKWKLRYEG